jgi:hypothetical protein
VDRALAQRAQDLLVEYGYPEAEIVLDEWNYCDNWMDVGPCWQLQRSLPGAAFNAAVLVSLQHSPCHISTYYDGQPSFSWCGLFSLPTMTVHAAMQKVLPRKGYYALKAFGELYRLGTEVLSVSDDEDVYVCAATDGKRRAVLLSNFLLHGAMDKVISLQVEVAGEICEALLLDETHDLQPVDLPKENIVLRANNVMLLWL